MKKKIIVKSESLLIGAMYFLLFSGGLWHVLDVFQTLMRILAAPMLISLSLVVTLATFLRIQNRKTRLHFLVWAIFVIVASFAIEWVGVKSGKIFGDYTYSEILQPQLFGVPIAIGFAWICMLLTSAAVLQKLFGKYSNKHFLLTASGISVFMVVFDLLMETAVLKLGYWTWGGVSIPLQNYIAWFVISFAFALLGSRKILLNSNFPPILFHAYFAQLIFFGLVIFK